MRYLTLATDYDGTLAEDGHVGDATIAALKRLRASGRKALLVTGRELPELLAIFPEIELFDWVVAENGALLYRPSDRSERSLAPPPPQNLIDALRQRGVDRLSVGRSVLATWRPYETTVLEAIRDLGLEYHVVFNKDAVMALPSAVTKASGLKAIMADTGLSTHNVVGVGDAENDHAFLDLCECGVAVSNAVPSLKERVDWVTSGARGAGVVELVDQLLTDDLATLEPRLTRHHLPIGTREGDHPVCIRPFGSNLLVTGSSGAGKSTLAWGFIERLAERGYRVCVIDPEGDYSTLQPAVIIGTPRQPPNLDEVLRLLERPGPNPVVNLVGIAAADRPHFFLSLFSRLHELRTTLGQPHWIVVDEAHHVLPVEWEHAGPALAEKLERMLLITLEAKSLAAPVASSIDTFVSVGEDAERALEQFAALRGLPPPKVPSHRDTDQAIVWRVQDGEPPFAMQIARGSAARQRHLRKYAEGDLGADRSFYFRGPDQKLNLKAQNLSLFAQLAEGIDAETWLHHLRRHDYSNWFRLGIKDPALADEAAAIEADQDFDADQSRAKIIELVRGRYTAPAVHGDGARTRPANQADGATPCHGDC